MKEAIIKAAAGVVISALWAFIVAGIRRLHAKQKAQDEGLKSLLRAEIIRTYEKSIERGYCAIYSKEAITHCYNAYKGLKGNGVIDSLFSAIMSLPTEASNEKLD